MPESETPGGRGEEPKSTELPVAARREFGAIAYQCQRRIPFTPKDYKTCRRKLMSALETCKHPRNVAMLTRVWAMLEKMNQTDEHFNIDHLRQREQFEQPAPAPQVNVAVVNVVNPPQAFDHDAFARQFDDFAKSGRFSERTPAPDGSR